MDRHFLAVVSFACIQSACAADPGAVAAPPAAGQWQGMDVRFRIEAGEGDGRTQGVVAAVGAELKPILVQDDGQWKIDRF